VTLVWNLPNLQTLGLIRSGLESIEAVVRVQKLWFLVVEILGDQAHN
jgi:hypothetical protein